MEIFNQGKYVSDLQIQQVVNLLPEQIRRLKVKVYITTIKEVFKQNKFKPRLERKVREFLEEEGEAIFYHREKTVFLFEDLLFEHHQHCPNTFYWKFVCLLIHELRHCEQANFLKKRLNVVLRNYTDYTQELEGNIEDVIEKMHWSEKDAYTYSYRFVENKKNEITDIFQLNTFTSFYPYDFEVDMQEIWESYKKEMDLIERFVWFIDDLYWIKPKMSILPSPTSEGLQPQS
ncbi:hypothetical protein [Bacillus sp. FSL R9-9410]|uniref:hypothetical protein n=1 Tax=Bacillus sp. FSL R9-9410 TaxID=2921590 RepID=UPI00310177D6